MTLLHFSRVLSGAPAGGGGGSYTPIIDNNFNSYADGTFASAMGGTFNGYTYGTASSTQAYGGSGKSVACSINASATDWGLASKLPTRLGENDEVWIRFRTFFPTGYDFDATPHLKFFRIDQGTVASGGHGAHLDWYIRFVGNAGDTDNVGFLDYIQENQQSWLYDYEAIPSGIVRNTWQTWNFYFKLHGTAAGGRIRIWRDSSLLADFNSRMTLGASDYVVGASSDGNAQGFMFSTYWNGGSPATQTCYIDDWQIATSASPPTATDSGGRTWIGLS